MSSTEIAASNSRQHLTLTSDRIWVIALAIPALILVGLGWLLTKLRHPNLPAFFFQERLGQYKVPITIIKIRTFIPGTSKTTWIGRVLRRAHIDELPQLVNVWFGDMNIVGPRPLIPDDWLTWEEKVRFCSRIEERFKLIPGLIGREQILGRHQQRMRTVGSCRLLSRELRTCSRWRLQCWYCLQAMLCVLKLNGSST